MLSKKLISILLAFLAAMSFTTCGKSDESNDLNNESTSSEENSSDVSNEDSSIDDGDNSEEELMFENSKWIWRSKTYSADEYAEFYFEFEGGEKVDINISADSNYAVYVNGTLATFGQYPDFPDYKIYDTVDISEYCQSGTNKCGIVVYYNGSDSFSTYYPSTPGLLFEIVSDGKVVAQSDESVVSRLSKAYRNHARKSISVQLGYTFHYSLNKEDDWMMGNGVGFANSVVTSKEVILYPRPCKKTELLDKVPVTTVLNENNSHYIFDLGAEQVGFIDFEIKSENEQSLLLTFGEHLADGSVRRNIGIRDFSVSFDLKAGTNTYMNPFLRLGCRYVELFFTEPVEITYVSVRPVVYPVTVLETDLTGLRKEIYDACVRTLICCMHDHYEDCPWREQAMYTLDSRNQMLCGYYAFGEYEFPRANLKLIAESMTEDNLLPICHPCGTNLYIPSFNLHFITQVKEYVEHSGDEEFLNEIWDVLQSVMGTFTSRLDNNLLPAFSGSDMWNFYEWSDGMSGVIGELNANRYDLSINCLMVSALKNMANFCELTGKEDIYTPYIEPMIKRINEVFYDETVGLYKNDDISNNFSQLGNALALLCGAVEDKNVSFVAEQIAYSDNITKASLSMECFIFDSLLSVDKEGYKDYVLNQLDTEYGYMLEQGATTFWETLDGEQAFEGAGSLCHGWSAMPIYYYNILL